jgi:hypothetical protein
MAADKKASHLLESNKMGRGDRRNSLKMKRRTRRRKFKDRVKRRRAERGQARTQG